MGVSLPSGGLLVRSPLSCNDHGRQLLSYLKTPQTLCSLKAIHGLVLKTGNSNNDVILGRLLLCCSLSKSMDYALAVFLSLDSPSIFFYNAMLKGYADNGDYDQCLKFYSFLRWRSVQADPFTFPPVLTSSGDMALTMVGEEIHGVAVKLGLDGGAVLRTAAMDMYFSCGLADRALLLFETATDRDIVFWNAAISGLGRRGELVRARELFEVMPERNTSSWNTMLGLYSREGLLRHAEKLFEEMPRRDIVSWNTMISGRCGGGDVNGARRLFDSMPERSVVSWNAMIGGYVQNCRFQEALDLFRKMQGSEISPSEVTLVAVAQACAHLGSLSQGKWVEALIRRRCLEVDLHLAAAMVDMYGKCGSLEDAQRIFEQARGRGNSVLCSSMIEVLASHGQAEEAFKVFKAMQDDGLVPNEVTFLGLLKACNHGGLVEQGRRVWKLMLEEFALSPSVEHYGAMIDLLGRAGRLTEAREMVSTMVMPPGLTIWSSLLSSCILHGAVELAEEVSLRVEELQPVTAGNLVLLSKAYAMAGRLEEAAAVRRRMKEEGMEKEPGCSSIEISGQTHEFLAGGRGPSLGMEEK
ncbi:pentatricopeptide repeat-containing protein At1g74630-like [Wolffia australiana]